MQSDEQLALEAQRGNADSLLALAERYYAPVFRYLYRMCSGNRMLAEDLTQDVFLRVQRGITRYQHPRPFKTWIYAIATNRMRDHWALRDTRDVDTMDAHETPADAADEGGEDVLIAREDAAQVRAALGALPADQRQTVLLYYYEDMTQSEVAAVLGIPVGTVKSRLFTGLKSLREMLERSAT